MSRVVWDITPCSSKTDRRFGGTYHLHLQGGEVSQERKQYAPKLGGLSKLHKMSLIFIVIPVKTSDPNINELL
jgi:hypothetical protein